MLEELYQPYDQMKRFHLSQEKSRLNLFMMKWCLPSIINQNQNVRNNVYDVILQCVQSIFFMKGNKC